VPDCTLRNGLKERGARGALTIKTKGDASMPRELIEPHKGDKRYVRRKSKIIVKKGEGDRGDRRR
jgi:hypothetical protein